MSFAAQQALSPDKPTALATNPVTYDLTVQNGAMSIRKVAGLDLDEPMILTVSHEKTKAGVRRHLVKTESVKQDATNPTIVGTITCHMVITVPPVVSTSALVKAEIHKLLNFVCATGYIDKLLNEET